jgi:hypothetical protein
MRFDMICEANGIEHRLTKPNHPWTNGQVERMNRTIKDATVKRFHYDSHDQLRTHLADFMAAYNFARRLKTLGGLTPYEYICKIWTSEPDRFILNPIHQMPGLNTYQVCRCFNNQHLGFVGAEPTDAHETPRLHCWEGAFAQEGSIYPHADYMQLVVIFESAPTHNLTPSKSTYCGHKCGTFDLLWE